VHIHTDIDNLGEIRNAVVTTGSFDGVHIGHQTLIRKLNDLAATVDGESVLITFYPHVRKVLYPETAGKDLEMISSQTEKMELLERTGLDHLIIINFTKEFAQTTAEEFVKNILVGKLRAKIIVVGFNHYFGHNKEGNYNLLNEWGKELGFKVHEIPKQDTDFEAVGSTRIRKSLKDGKIQTANAYLDHIYFIRSGFSPGDRFLNESGLLNYKIWPEEDSKLIPPNGVYAVRIDCENEHCKGMLINNSHPGEASVYLDNTLYVSVLDSDKDLMEKEGKVFVHKLICRFNQCRTQEELLQNLNRLKAEIDELIY